MFEKRTGEILADMLIDQGVQRIYGMPGDSINEFVDDLRKKEDSLDFIQIRHEEVGAFAASSQAKLTGELGVCLSIAGPGAVHLLNGLYDAKKDGVPTLAIVGQVHSDQVGTDAFQEINLERMFDGVGVYNRRAEKAEQLPYMLHEAIKSAYTQRGPSVLIVPDDLFTVRQKQHELEAATGWQPNPKIVPHQDDMRDAAGRIDQAKQPVILAGRGNYHARHELSQFAEKIKAPVILSLLGKGALPDSHPHNLGQHGQIGTKPAFEAMMETDLLLLIGTSFPYRSYLPKDAKAIQIDINPDQIAKVYPASIGLCGDAKEVLPHLTEEIAENDHQSFLQKYQKKMENWNSHVENEKAQENNPIQGPQVIGEVAKHTKDDATISLDVGNVTVWTTRFFPFTNQNLLVSGGLASMGSGLPGAIAAQLADPKKQVVAICGDGGFAMVMQDFITAVKYQLPIKVVILNNEMIGMIKYEQQTTGNLNYETDLKDADYAAFARACGGEGYRVHQYDELASKMAQAFAYEGPVIVDVGIEDLAPLPGKITYDQAVKYGQHLIKEFFSDKNIEFPDTQKVLERL